VKQDDVLVIYAHEIKPEEQTIRILDGRDDDE
jgi:hypothetical protein